jgi:hypothetical protein
MEHMSVLGRSGVQTDEAHRASAATPSKTHRCPTEGRAPLNCGRVPHLCRCFSIAMRRAPNHGLRGRGQMAPYSLKPL